MRFYLSCVCPFLGINKPMACYLSWVCPCLGLKEPKKEEDVKLSTVEFIKQQNELDSLSNDELQKPIYYYMMNKRKYYNI